MLTFQQYIFEATISANPDSDVGHRHFTNYIEPFLPGNAAHNELTHRLHNGTPVTIVGTHIDRSGNAKRMVSVRTPDGRPLVVSASKLQKPPHLVKNVGAAGFLRERKLSEQLVKHGLMDKVETAGSSHGNDFHINIAGKKTEGTEAESLKIGGESKIGFGAKFGESAIRWHPEKGWHFSDTTKQKRPQYTSLVESMKFQGKSLFNHLNEQWPNGNVGKTIRIPVGIEAAHSYLEDHHVGILHIHSHGTYAIGKSPLSDHLPKFTGSGGYLEIRSPGKGRTPRITSYLKGRNVPKSPVDLMNNEHASELAKKLGIGEK